MPNTVVFRRGGCRSRFCFCLCFCLCLCLCLPSYRPDYWCMRLCTVDRASVFRRVATSCAFPGMAGYPGRVSDVHRERLCLDCVSDGSLLKTGVRRNVPSDKGQPVLSDGVLQGASGREGVGCSVSGYPAAFGKGKPAESVPGGKRRSFRSADNLRAAVVRPSFNLRPISGRAEGPAATASRAA